MYKFYCCFLLAFAASGFCFLLNKEDDKENVLLLFSTTPNSPTILLNESNVNILDPNKTTVFLIHGWFETKSTNYYPAMFAEFDKKGGYNVIRVDWSKYARSGYFTASHLLDRGGRYLGNFIYNFLQPIGIVLSRVHLIGHSLGAHFAGYAGKQIISMNGRLGRITGLDPAGPRFGFISKSKDSLGSTDATMVDCLYTNRGIFGTLLKLGTHNFYANKATFQPGCPLDGDNKTNIPFCDHQRSTSLYSESINSNQFIAVKLNSTPSGPIIGTLEVDKSVKVIFGENTNATAGSYQFNTKSSEPYALG